MRNRMIGSLLVLTCLLISGCGHGETLKYTDESYIYKQFFEEEYSVREDEISVDESISRIVFLVSATSGQIDLTITDEKSDEVIEYQYVVDDYLSEEIEIDKKNRKDKWSYTVKKYEDTEGVIRINYY